MFSKMFCLKSFHNSTPKFTTGKLPHLHLTAVESLEIFIIGGFGLEDLLYKIMKLILEDLTLNMVCNQCHKYPLCKNSPVLKIYPGIIQEF